MKPMKLFPVLLLCSSALVHAAGLSAIQSVYVMPMSRGIDQFIANRITNEKLFRVVTDPKLADAIFTDRIDDAFVQRLADITPESAAEKQGTAGQQLDDPASRSSFGRGKGTFFLVESKSREVVWSTFEAPKSSLPKDLNRSASDVVDRLRRAKKK